MTSGEAIFVMDMNIKYSPRTDVTDRGSTWDDPLTCLHGDAASRWQMISINP